MLVRMSKGERNILIAKRGDSGRGRPGDSCGWLITAHSRTFVIRFLISPANTKISAARATL